MDMNPADLKEFATPDVMDDEVAEGDAMPTPAPLGPTEAWAAAAQFATVKLAEAQAAADEAAAAAEMCEDCPAAASKAAAKLADAIKDALESAQDVAEQATELATEEMEEAAEEAEAEAEEVAEEEAEAAADAADEEPADEEPAEMSDEDVAAAAAEEVANGEAPDAVEMMAGYDPETDGNPPAWVADEATWDRAKAAVDPEGAGAGYDQPWAVVAHVYEKMGGTKK